MNETMVNIILVSNYDHNGAIIYTIVILLFYSLILFCSLILYTDRDDHYYENNWSANKKDTKKKTFHSSQSDILNSLSDQSLRMRYWRIYYGDNGLRSLSNNFVSDELKRISVVSKCIKELNSEQMKQSSKHREFIELKRTNRNNSQISSADPLASSSLFNFRRARSVSVPGVYQSDCSYGALCEIPSCKPSPIITFTKCS